MYCQHCGKEIQINSIFCNHCGMQQGVVQEFIEKGNLNNKKFYWSFLSVSSLIFLGLSIISLFLPWVKARSSASGFGQTISWSSNSFPGIMTVEGGVAFLLLICSGVFLFKRKFWAYTLSLLSLIISILLIYRLDNVGSSYSSSYGSASAEFKFEFGSIAFIVSTLLYTLFCVCFVHNNRTKTKMDEATKRGYLIAINIILLLINIPIIKSFNIYFKYFNDDIFLFLLLPGLSIFLLHKLNYKYAFRYYFTGFALILAIALFYLAFDQKSENIIDSISLSYLIFKIIFIISFWIIFIYEIIQFRKSETMNNIWINVFKPIYLLLTFIISFLSSFIYFSLTRHYVTESEKNNFVKDNSFLNGNWYFLSKDSMSIYKLNIKFNAYSDYNNGEIDFSYTSYIYKDEIQLSENGVMNYSSKQNYQYKQKLPLNFNNTLVINEFKSNEISGDFKENGTTINFVASNNPEKFLNLISYNKLFNDINQIVLSINSLTKDTIFENEYYQTQQFSNGDIYYGEVSNNQRNGFGKYYYSETGDYYIGYWRENEKNGKGTFYKVGDTITYKGYYQNGKHQGIGYKKRGNGEYFGEWIDNLENGKGKYVWYNGDTYIGEWSNGERTGRGKYIWKNGSIFVGEFYQNNTTNRLVLE
jgi:hypothetical protein